MGEKSTDKTGILNNTLAEHQQNITLISKVFKSFNDTLINTGRFNAVAEHFVESIDRVYASAVEIINLGAGKRVSDFSLTSSYKGEVLIHEVHSCMRQQPGCLLWQLSVDCPNAVIATNKIIRRGAVSYVFGFGRDNTLLHLSKMRGDTL